MRIIIKPHTLALAALVLAAGASAQTFNVLTNISPALGFAPEAGLTALTPPTTQYTGGSGTQTNGGTPSVLYGTTYAGGTGENGTLFAINSDGSGYTNLHSFAGDDGANPLSVLVLSDGVLYGTTGNPGGANAGTVFAVNTDGTGFTVLHAFNWDDGSQPICNSGLVLSGGTLYGTTVGGGTYNQGTVFSVNTDGSGFTTLHTFTGGDGSEPWAGLVLSSNRLYGTTTDGGSSGSWSLFAINTDGTGFTTFFHYNGGGSSGSTNSAGPAGAGYDPMGLIISSNTLYGTTVSGPGEGSGTVFAVGTDGTGFTNLHCFDPAFSTTSFPTGDGLGPRAGLVLSGGVLYGTTQQGGSLGYGTVFQINTDGSGYAILHSLAENEGAEPYGGLLLLDNTLYGATVYGPGGFFSEGSAIFSLSLAPTGDVIKGSAPPQLSLNLSGSKVVLGWPMGANDFSLQSSTSFGPHAVWSTVPTVPTIVNGQFTVTAAVSGAQKFYRLNR